MNADQPNSLVDAILWSLFLFPAGISSVAFGVIILRFEYEKQKERVDLPFYAWLKTLGSTILIFATFVSLGVYIMWDSFSRFLLLHSR